MPEVIFNGPEGRLEGRYHHAEEENAPIALILHNEPGQPGGTMNSKIVYTLFQSFVRLNFSVLRFNFRSVGRSQGNFEGGPGELGDAASALDWLQSYNKNADTCWIAGHDFGAWTGMQLLMRRPEISGFISVSPPADSRDFSFLAPCPSSGLVIHGSNDSKTSDAAARGLAEKLTAQKNIRVDYLDIPGGMYDFENNLRDVHRNVYTYVAKRMRSFKKKPVVKRNSR